MNTKPILQEEWQSLKYEEIFLNESIYDIFLKDDNQIKQELSQMIVKSYAGWDNWILSDFKQPLLGTHFVHFSFLLTLCMLNILYMMWVLCTAQKANRKTTQKRSKSDTRKQTCQQAVPELKSLLSDVSSLSYELM